LGLKRVSNREKRSLILAEFYIETETMALDKDQYAMPNSLLPPRVKDLLESLALGRLGLGIGCKIIQILRKLRHPVQRKLSFPTLPLKPGLNSWLVSLFDHGREVDVWLSFPEMAISAEIHQHLRDEWNGILNVPCVFGIQSPRDKPMAETSDRARGELV
jgi:hypothetical protein